jgi:two-component system, cell cycle response regulator
MDVAPLTLLLLDTGGPHSTAVRDAVRDAATATGGRLLEASDLPDLIALSTTESVDVMMLDLTGTSPDPLEMLTAVRRSEPELPIVAVADLDAIDAPVLASHGAQDVLPRQHLSRALLQRSLRYAVDRHRMQRTLSQLSLSDGVSGLYNRHGFFTLAEYHLRLAKRTRGLLAGVFAIEPVDGCSASPRQVHVELGTALLRQVFRISDVLAHFGGAEFAVLAVDAAPESRPIIEHRLDEQSRLLASRARLTAPLRVTGVLDTVISLDGVEQLQAQLAGMRAARRTFV